MVTFNKSANILSNKEALEKFSGIIIERPAGRQAVRSELKSWFETEKVNVVRVSGRTPIINPVLMSKKRTRNQ